MSANNRNLLRASLSIVFLLAAALACGPTPEEKTVVVTINSPFSGSVVAVGENVTIDSTATADGGIRRPMATRPPSGCRSLGRPRQRGKQRSR